MRLFDDEAPRAARGGADWETHRAHRSPGSGPPEDELGVLALAPFVPARTADVAVAVRSVTAYSDGLLLDVAVLLADEQSAEDLTGRGESPEAEPVGDPTPRLQLLSSAAGPLRWASPYWLHPLPSDGPLVVGCRWPDRRIPEPLTQRDAVPLLAAAASSGPVRDEPLT